MHKKTDYSKKKVALVLAGGAARGFSHVGVLKGLEKLGIQPTTIVGTSMGAIVGAYYGAFHTYKDTRLELKKHKWYDVLSIKDLIATGGLVKGNKIINLLRHDIGNISFKNFNFEFIVNATDMNTGDSVSFTNGKVIDAVRCSISLPVIFNPVHYKIHGKDRLLTDGGVSANLFFEPLIPRAKEFDLIILVHLDYTLPKYKKKIGIKDMAVHTYHVYQKNQVKMLLNKLDINNSKEAKIFKKKMVIIKPKLDTLNAFSFDSFDSFVKKGYNAFEKEFPKMKKILNS